MSTYGNSWLTPDGIASTIIGAISVVVGIIGVLLAASLAFTQKKIRVSYTKLA